MLGAGRSAVLQRNIADGPRKSRWSGRSRRGSWSGSQQATTVTPLGITDVALCPPLQEPRRERPLHRDLRGPSAIFRCKTALLPAPNISPMGATLVVEAYS